MGRLSYIILFSPLVLNFVLYVGGCSDFDMADITDFVESPKLEVLNKFTKDQLLRVADHYSIRISDKSSSKEVVKSEIKAFLCDLGILTLTEEEPHPVPEEKWPGEPGDGLFQHLPIVSDNLTFEQKKELFVLQSQRQVEIERLRIEQSRLDIEKVKLELIKEGKLSAGVSANRSSLSGFNVKDFDIFCNLGVVPKYNEKDPDTFFSLFERVTDVCNWPESACTLMLQCVLTGRAQETYASLSPEDSKRYSLVKSAVLKAFELVL